MPHDLSVYEKMVSLQAYEQLEMRIMAHMSGDKAADRIQSQLYGAAYNSVLDLRVYGDSWVSMGTAIHKAVERKHRGDEGAHPYWFVRLQISCEALKSARFAS
jgi:hypothetical protein